MSAAITSEASSERYRRTWFLEAAVLIVAAVVLVGFRLHAFDLPLETDECNYAYIGGRLLAGDRLYEDVWDHQPPGAFVLFAAAQGLFGAAPAVFRWMAVLFSLASMGLIFALLRRLSGPVAGIGGAFLFAVVSADSGTAGEGCNREIYMNTLILAGWYAMLRSGGRLGPWLFAGGAALAIGSWIKTVVAVHWVFLAVWLGACAWRDASGGRRLWRAGVAVLVFGAAPLMLWVGTFAYFLVTDRWHSFIDAVFLFNMSYSESAEPFLSRFATFFDPPRHPFTFDSALPLWVIGGVAVIGLVVDAVWPRLERAAHLHPRGRSDFADAARSEDRGSPKGSGLIVLLAVAGYVSVCLPAHFWPHYYYLMIPALVLAVGLIAGRSGVHLRARTQPGYATAAEISVIAVVGIALLFTQYRDYLSQPPFGITVKRYNSRDFWGRAQGENVRRVTDPDDEIFVFGNEAEIYYYAQRQCASRFTMITALQTGFADVERRRRILMEELEADPPRVILVLFDERQPWAEWKAFLREHYGEPVGWDFHDRTGEAIMFVLARKDAPIEAIDWNWDRSEVGGWFPGEGGRRR